MHARKTTTLVLAAASLAFGLTACSSSSDDQRTSAVATLEKRGFKDIQYVSQNPSVPIGDGLMYFTASAGKCREIEVSVRPGQDLILFDSLSKAESDAFFSAATVKDTIGNAIFSACKAPVG